MALSDTDRAILELERTWWANDAPKEVAIEQATGLTARAYYESLAQLLDRPDALAEEPVLVRRLRRLRDRRRRGRQERDGERHGVAS